MGSTLCEFFGVVGGGGVEVVHEVEDLLLLVLGEFEFEGVEGHTGEMFEVFNWEVAGEFEDFEFEVGGDGEVGEGRVDEGLESFEVLEGSPISKIFLFFQIHTIIKNQFL